MLRTRAIRQTMTEKDWPQPKKQHNEKKVNKMMTIVPNKVITMTQQIELIIDQKNKARHNREMRKDRK